MIHVYIHTYICMKAKMPRTCESHNTALLVAPLPPKSDSVPSLSPSHGLLIILITLCYSYVPTDPLFSKPLKDKNRALHASVAPTLYCIINLMFDKCTKKKGRNAGLDTDRI